MPSNWFLVGEKGGVGDNASDDVESEKREREEKRLKAEAAAAAPPSYKLALPTTSFMSIFIDWSYSILSISI